MIREDVKAGDLLVVRYDIVTVGGRLKYYAGQVVTVREVHRSKGHRNPFTRVWVK